MKMLTLSLTAFGSFALLVHLVTVVTAARRRAITHPSITIDLPPVSIIRPVCGLTAIDMDALRSTFHLDYPGYEIVLCVDRKDDLAIPFCKDLIAQHPHIPSKLLVGRTFSSENPKLDNVDKGWTAAKYEWIVIADCNVLMPTDYLHGLLGARGNSCGLVCAPPVGIHAEGIWAEIESAFLNTYQARWQFAADAVGLGYAQGKSMLWRQSFLNANGGIRALAAEVAEDAAATKLVRAAGLHVRLASRPSLQPLGRRTMAQVWQRQLRWAQLRRQSFPKEFALEILTSVALPIIGAFLIANAEGGLFWLTPLLLVAIWFGAEAWLAWRAGWGLTRLTLLAMIAREFMMVAVWCAAWRANGYVWQGQKVSLAANGAVSEAPTF